MSLRKTLATAQHVFYSYRTDQSEEDGCKWQALPHRCAGCTRRRGLGRSTVDAEDLVVS